jgi:hypothetical protein
MRYARRVLRTFGDRTRRRSRSLGSSTVLALVLSGSGVASGAIAQEPLEQNDFAIDLVNGPVLGSGRIVGLAGAYSALAEGIDGAPWNPAAYGSRTLWELDWFEWEVTISFLFPGLFSDNDFFFSGEDRGFRFDQFLFTTFGFRLQFGDFGFGALPRLQSYSLESPTGETIEASFTTANWGAAQQFYDGQIILGAGFRTAVLGLSAADGQELVAFSGTSPELGMLVRFEDEPWRLAFAGRFAVSSTEVSGDAVEIIDGVRRTAGFILPNEVHVPWEFQFGFAFQIGERPLNRRFVDPEDVSERLARHEAYAAWLRERDQVARERREPNADDPYEWLDARAEDPEFLRRERAIRARTEDRLDRAIEIAEEEREQAVLELSRLYLLVSMELLVTGPTHRGIGLEGFLSQLREPAGAEPTLGVRLGLEGEPWPNRVKLRAGTYIEPSRFAEPSIRVHLTGGLEFRLFSWDFFGLLDESHIRVGASIDWADSYLDWGFGVGFWH